MAAVARKPLRDILRGREEEGLFGWTLCALPTEEAAKQAGMTLDRYTAQIVKACYLDKADPVGAWKKIYRDAGRIKAWLNRMDVDHYRVESNRCDLKVSLGRGGSGSESRATTSRASNCSPLPTGGVWRGCTTRTSPPFEAATTWKA